MPISRPWPTGSPPPWRGWHRTATSKRSVSQHRVGPIRQPASWPTAPTMSRLSARAAPFPPISIIDSACRRRLKTTAPVPLSASCVLAGAGGCRDSFWSRWVPGSAAASSSTAVQYSETRVCRRNWAQSALTRTGRPTTAAYRGPSNGWPAPHHWSSGTLPPAVWGLHRRPRFSRTLPTGIRRHVPPSMVWPAPSPRRSASW